MSRTARSATERLRTEALLVRRVPFGEADVMVTLFTEERGIVSAVARSARRSSKRFPSIEPMHLLRVGVETRPGADVGFLAESAISRPRMRLVGDLDRLEAAGHALRWVRRAAPPQTREPALWVEINALLDGLDVATPDAAPTDAPAEAPNAMLAAMGLRMLVALGWGMDLERCVRCGRPCASGASAYIDPAEGGLVCRSCGGGPILLRGDRRERLLAALSGAAGALAPEDVRGALEIVEAALAAHG
jgi:DNA repair protein RecO (recombination protein O)